MQDVAAGVEKFGAALAAALERRLDVVEGAFQVAAHQRPNVGPMVERLGVVAAGQRRPPTGRPPGPRRRRRGSRGQGPDPAAAERRSGRSRRPVGIGQAAGRASRFSILSMARQQRRLALAAADRHRARRPAQSNGPAHVADRRGEGAAALAHGSPARATTAPRPPDGRHHGRPEHRRHDQPEEQGHQKHPLPRARPRRSGGGGRCRGAGWQVVAAGTGGSNSAGIGNPSPVVSHAALSHSRNRRSAPGRTPRQYRPSRVYPAGAGLAAEAV